MSVEEGWNCEYRVGKGECDREGEMRVGMTIGRNGYVNIGGVGMGVREGRM